MFRILNILVKQKHQIKSRYLLQAKRLLWKTNVTEAED